MGKSSKTKNSNQNNSSDDELDELISDCVKEVSEVHPQHTNFTKLQASLNKSGWKNSTRLKSSTFGAWNGGSIDTAKLGSSLYDANEQVVPSLQRAKTASDTSCGKGWFDIEPMVVTEELKKDIKVIQMRNYLDSKRFYKNTDKVGKVLHIGTVVGGSGDSRSLRLTKKERKKYILDEILADKKISRYSKSKYLAIQKDKSNKRKTFKKITRSKR